jgi:hypothetical protein
VRRLAGTLDSFPEGRRGTSTRGGLTLILKIGEDWQASGLDSGEEKTS